MNLINPYRDSLARIPMLNDVFDLVLAKINALWNVEHDIDGHHTAITADSVTTTGDVTVGGDLAVTGDGSFDGNVTADADEDPVSIGRNLGSSAGAEGSVGHGLSVGSIPSVGFGFDWLAWFSGTYREVRLQWRGPSNQNDNPVRVRYETADTSYHLMPGPVTNVLTPCDLGSPSDSFNAGRWRAIYGGIIDAAAGFKERSRTAYMGEYTAWTPTLAAATGTWTASGFTCNYTIVGKSLTLLFDIAGGNNTAVTGSLTFTLPGGFSAAFFTWNPITLYDNGVALTDGVVFATGAGVTTILVARTSGTAIAINAANGLYVRGQMTVAIQ